LTALIILGATLFGLGATSEHITRQAERDFPPEGRIVEAGGIRLPHLPILFNPTPNSLPKKVGIWEKISENAKRSTESY
ncbi:MAG: hypothetical protein F6K32_07820, partial [Desertifilum sp. SIO1I2]|nr:hypothetical protein [Desertifilum sp. SIO1I2]